MRLDIVPGLARREMFQPPRVPALGATFGAEFGAMQQVTLADDSDHTASRIDDRGTADAPLRQQCRQILDCRVRVDGNHGWRHHVCCAHYYPPMAVRLLCAADNWTEWCACH